MLHILTIKRISGIAAILSLSLVSCKKNLLDTASESQLSSADVYKSPKRIEGLLNGVYKTLKNEIGKLYLNKDVRGEDFINQTNNAYNGFDGWANNYTTSSADVEAVWDSAYASINASNMLITGLQGVTGVISDSVKNQYIAEARFLRAFNYFHLVTLYARPYVDGNGTAKGLPLRLISDASVAGKNLARSTVAEVYTQIISDLDFAEKNLPLTFSTAELNTTRAHRNTAIALKTRVYLNMGQYANVVTEAVKIVPQSASPFSATSGVANALQSSIATVFTTNYTTTESVFSLPVTTADPPLNPLGGYYNVNADFSLNLATAGIWNDAQLASSDARRALSRTTAGGLVFLMKFAKTSPYLDYIPVIRYSEVLLNYAEASAQQGNLNLATSLLKAVHGRSDASYVFPSDSTSSQSSLVNTILKERRIELLGEGFRSNDLLRKLLPLPSKASSSFTARQVNPTEDAYIFPLPNGEILTNKLL